MAAAKDAPPPVLFRDTWVTHYARVDRGVGFTGAPRIFQGGKLLGRVPRLALGEGTDGRWWLAHCGRTWNVRVAFDYASLEEARERAERRYPGVSTRWVRTGYTRATAEAYLNRVSKGEECSFCKRRPDQVDQMFSRPDVRICEVCVGRFASFVAADRANRPGATHRHRVSFGEPVSLLLRSRVLVLIDPLALHRARRVLRALADLPERARRARLAALSTTVRIGRHQIERFRPGLYDIGSQDVVSARGTGAGIVDVASGAIVVTDLDGVPALARALTRECYDALLTRKDGDVAAERLVREMQGPRFAVLKGCTWLPFAGDGAYRLRRGAPVRRQSAG